MGERQEFNGLDVSGSRTLARAGRRERLVPKTSAPGLPFDNGTFDLVEEPLEAD